uniref:exodeoxyribonuclease VII large subunit n=1 Tax=Gemmiger formicilis TaxID=745368 RepID=UPI0040252BE6
MKEERSKIKSDILLRVRLLYVLFILAGAVVLGRLVWVQLFSSEVAYNAERLASRIFTEETIPAQRGSILSRGGAPLATSIFRYQAAFDFASPGLDSLKTFREQSDSLAKLLAAFFRDKSAAEYSRKFREEHARRYRLVNGRDTISERDGAFQLYADYMKPFGAGAAQMAFDALYKKLEAEGLFAPERKRPLPAVPRCIGVVTSKTGAAWQDVQNVIGRRWPMVKLLLAPVSVQGIEAEKSIVDGIRSLDRDPRPDLILVTRGGGSKEDLWVFNSERIARAAAACRRPVVSAVGHEIDTSILDYVADLRAPTPSAAAELCVPDQGDVRQKIFILQQNIQKNIQNRCNLCYNRFNQLATAQLLQRQHQQLDRRGQELAIAQAAVRQAAQRHVQDARRSLQSAAAVAESLSPYAVLARGYALPEQNGTPCAVETLRPGEAVTLRGARAAAECRVEAVHTLEQKTGE